MNMFVGAVSLIAGLVGLCLQLLVPVPPEVTLCSITGIVGGTATVIGSRKE